MAATANDTVLRRAPVVLLDDMGGGVSRLYATPVDVIIARSLDEVVPALEALEAALGRGLHAAGFIAYEAAAAFEPRVRDVMPAGSGPFLWFGLFDGYEPLLAKDVARLIDANMGGTSRPAGVADLALAISRERYSTDLSRIFAYLAAGDCYQVNYTADLGFHVEGDSLALYRDLRAAQPVKYGAWIDHGEGQILSLSPELFLKRTGTKLTAKPMKGTAARGATVVADEDARSRLAADPKAQAENLMIVDLLRNDLSRLARPGTVEVAALFEVEAYPSLLQLVSTITAEIDRNVGPSKLIPALFPCGSVTGAPKIRAMEIIAELETRPRGVYTGAIGWFAPDGDFALSVPIRTIEVAPDNSARMGVGGGIVAESVTSDEFAEMCLKGQFLTAPDSSFDLFETMLFDGTRFARLEAHLNRLAHSARRFGFRFDERGARTELLELAGSLEAPARIRLSLAASGAIAAMAQPLPAAIQDARAGIMTRSAHPLHAHKTTVRGWADHAMAEAKAAGLFEMLFVNERGELTEGSFTNLFIERDGRLLTPHINCGLLPGILRGELLASGAAAEAILTLDDLKAADRVFVGNALRGLIEVTIEWNTQPS